MRRSSKGLGRPMAVLIAGMMLVGPVSSASAGDASAAAKKAVAAAAISTSTPMPYQEPPRPGYTRTRFEVPITIHPGANINKLTGPLPKPSGNVYLKRMQPNLVLDDGDSNPANDRVPRTDIIHLHHMVWLVSDPRNSGRPQGFNLPFGAGEEKTISAVPDGYGYPVYSDQVWNVNDMIHNLTPATIKGKIVYDLDWVAMDSDLGRTLKPAYPLWLDVQRGSGYPVFDTFRGMGANGTVTYPDQFTNPYGSGSQRNVYTADRDLTLLGTAGHVHPGGLYTDLQVQRTGADGSASPQPGTLANSARAFRSNAVYWDPSGPISWDMAMEATPEDWRVHVKPGDKLRISATYETRKSDWYESMGIMVVWTALNSTVGSDPFTDSIAWDSGTPTHGSYPENKNYGGSYRTLNDPTKLPRGVTPSGSTIKIKDFVYQYGDLSLSGTRARPPVVKKGKQLTFLNLDAPKATEPDEAQYTSIYHSITDCKAPCNKNTGLSYPLADGAKTFDSGQLGYAPLLSRIGQLGTAAANRRTWKTPSNLNPGTYTYFCRVHPFMRGAFRVVK